jgi:hypothetical protein
MKDEINKKLMMKRKKKKKEKKYIYSFQNKNDIAKIFEIIETYVGNKMHTE